MNGAIDAGRGAALELWAEWPEGRRERLTVVAGETTGWALQRAADAVERMEGRDEWPEGADAVAVDASSGRRWELDGRWWVPWAP